jgi:tripartite-type tricarboxylate transporter receptor subunit TctC
VQLSFISVPAAIGQIKAGKVRALAVTGAKRSQVVPDLPTIAEAALPGYAADQWYGVLVPRSTPRAIVTRLNQDFAWAVSQPDTRSRLRDSGYEIATDTSEEWFGRFIKAEIVKWAKVIKATGMKAD